MTPTRDLALALALGACGFSAGGASSTPSDSAAHDAARDAMPDVAIDAAPDGPVSGACLGAWCQRKAIRIHGDRVTGGPHAQFPVLVELAADADLAAGARADGFDLVFTAGDGATRLPYDRAQFTKATGALVAWVAVPSLAGNADTTIYLYWGNASAADQQAPSAAWDASYRGVWHFDETSGPLHDATANANAATAQNGAAIGVAGAIGGAVSFDGSNDYVRVPASASLTATSAGGTFALWVDWANVAVGHFQYMLSTSNALTASPDGYSWSAQPGGAFYFYPWDGDMQDYNLCANPFTNHAWHYTAVTFDASSRAVAIYVDGVATALTTTNTPSHWTKLAAPADFLLGGNPTDSTGYFAGAIDEVRVSTAVRSPGWIATEYANQHAPAAFYAIGPAELLP